MVKHRAVIVGAGRIGAGFNWNDDAYTHAGAYRALSDRVELIGFVEPNQERAEAAAIKWKVPALKSIDAFSDFDIVSICTPDYNHAVDLVNVMRGRDATLKACWMEKPFSVVGPGEFPLPTQVNYLRRADPTHRELAKEKKHKRLIVYGKDDETTRCHFRDLSRWWNVPLDYRSFNGPCAYILETRRPWPHWFDNGGINPGECMRKMCENLLDHIDNGTELWSPPYTENA